MEQVRIALIGMGGMGRKYAEMIVNGGEDFPLKLTVVCCRREEAKQWAAEHLGDRVTVMESSDLIFANPDLYDAVLIVTPSKTHVDLAVQAFALGKHVFLDKPSGTALLECDRLNRAATASGKQFALMFHQHLYPKYCRVKELIEQGVLGKITRASMVNTRYFRTEFYHRSGTWRSSWNGEGGGLLMNQAQHPLDIWYWLFGMPDSIYASVPFGKYNSFTVDDEATILMEYSDRMTGSFTASTGEGENIDRLEISGTKGSLRLDGDKLDVWTYETDLDEYRKKALCTERQELKAEHFTEVLPTGREPYPEMLRNFGEAILKNEPILVPGWEGRASLELACGAYLSAWTGSRLQLPIDPERYEQELEQHKEPVI